VSAAKRWTASAVSTLVAALVATPTAAQTPTLQADVDAVVEALRAAGVTDRATLAAALRAAWDAPPADEFAHLRRLGVTVSDAEFAGAWQNQAGRATQFDPYDLEEWVTDVVRGWAKVRPREAFTWTFAVRSRFAFDLPRRSAFERIVTDWARVGPQAGREAEAEAVAIRDAILREEAIIGVVRGNILRGDASRVGALFEHITDEARRSEIRALHARYIR
jgi:hypothetical protein